MVKRRNGTIDIFRLVFSALIVMIHYSGNFKIYSISNNTIGRLGVPFFFMVTGFFYFSKQRRMHQLKWLDTWKYLREILLLWIIWTIVYVYKIGNLQKNPIILKFSIVRSLFGLHFEAGMLWYLIAAFEGLIIVQFIKVKFGEKYLNILFCFSLIACLLGSGYGNILGYWPKFQNIYLFWAPQNSVLSAIIWYTVSLKMVEKKSKLKTIGKFRWLILMTLMWGAELAVIFVFNLKTSTDTVIMLIPVAICFFAFLLNHPIYLSQSLDWFICKLSLYVYVTQTFAGDIVNFLMISFRFKSIMSTPVYYLFVLSVDLLISVLILLVEFLFKSKKIYTFVK